MFEDPETARACEFHPTAVLYEALAEFWPAWYPTYVDPLTLVAFWAAAAPIATVCVEFVMFAPAPDPTTVIDELDVDVFIALAPTAVFDVPVVPDVPV